MRPFSEVAALLVFSLAILTSPPLAMADRFEPRGGGWLGYVNDRYGTTFDYPADLFSDEPVSEDSNGRVFNSKDAILEIRAWPLPDEEDAASFMRVLLASEGYEDVTYSPSGSTWFVVSGYRGDIIFYEKYLFRQGILHAFSMQFSAAAKPHYAPILERMEDSFRVNSLHRGKAPLALDPVAAPSLSAAPVTPSASPAPLRDRLRLPSEAAQSPQ